MTRDRKTQSVEERLAALEAENEHLRDRLTQTVARFDDAEMTMHGQFVEDQTYSATMGLKKGLYPYLARKDDGGRMLQLGYRRALPGDFEANPTGPEGNVLEMTADEVFQHATTAGLCSQGHELWVCPLEVREARMKREQARSDAAADGAMRVPTHRDPQTRQPVFMEHGQHGDRQR